MGWVCMRGHFICVNLNVELEDQTPGGAKPPYGAVCHCGCATFPVRVCSSDEFKTAFKDLRRSAREALYH